MKTYGVNYLLLLFLFSSCLSNHEYLVESDYSYSGKFTKYKSFSFIDMVDSDGKTKFKNEDIEDAITYRMNLHGYDFDDSKPNLYVSYKIFYKDLKFQGFNQPDIQQWVKTEKEDEEYDPVKYNLKEGTLLITFWDRKRKKVIWQGYASSVVAKNDFEDKKYIKKAVRSIFDRYQFFAEGFFIEG